MTQHMRACALYALVFAFASANIAAQENIRDVRENYNIGQTVTVVGVVTSDDNLGSVRYLQDASAGIAIYPGQDWSSWDATPHIGDSLSVTGEITEFNGLLEVGPNLDAVEFLGAGTVPTPQVITPAQMDEFLEGQLVQINGVTFPLAGTYIMGNNTYDFTSGGESGVIYVRTSNGLVGNELTGCEVGMVGIVSQFSFDGLGGYQLLPRGPVDLIPTSDLCFTSPVVQTNLEATGFRLSWTTDLPCDGTVEYGLTEALGSVATALQNNTPSHFVNLEGLEPGTIYYARAVCTNADGSTVSSSIRPYATVSESSGDIHVYFNGAVDHSVATEEPALSIGVDMNDTIASWISRAQHTLDVAAFNFNDPTLEDAFNVASSNGVQIRWIYENQNANIGLGNLDPGIARFPRLDGEGSGMHNNFIVGDADYPESAFVLTGSSNLTTVQLTSDLNNVIVFEDQSLARAYVLEFEEMWGTDGLEPDVANSKFGADKTWNTPVNFVVGGSEVELYFSPSDGTTAAIQQEIEAAHADFEFSLFSFTRDDLAESIVSLNQNFFASPVGIIEQINVTGSEFDNLIGNGVQVYAHDPDENCHHNYCIVDHSEPGSDPIVITGSHTWTNTAENINDENTVIVHDARVANLYHQEFRAFFLPPQVEGCTDSEAINFDPESTADDGSCIYFQPSCDFIGDDAWDDFDLGIYSDSALTHMLGVEAADDIVLHVPGLLIDPNTGSPFGVSAWQNINISGMPDGLTFDAVPNSVNGNSQLCLSYSGIPTALGTFFVEVSGEMILDFFGTQVSIGLLTSELPIVIEPNPNPVPGCTYDFAANYNPIASVDDGSCVLEDDEEEPADCVLVFDGDGDGNVGSGDLLGLLTEFGASCD